MRSIKTNLSCYLKLNDLKATIDGSAELWLEEESGKVVLKGKDKRGYIKNLMIFWSRRFQRVESAELEGLQTDSDGRILEE